MYSLKLQLKSRERERAKKRTEPSWAELSWVDLSDGWVKWKESAQQSKSVVAWMADWVDKKVMNTATSYARTKLVPLSGFYSTILLSCSTSFRFDDVLVLPNALCTIFNQICASQKAHNFVFFFIPNKSHYAKTYPIISMSEHSKIKRERKIRRSRRRWKIGGASIIIMMNRCVILFVMHCDEFVK